MSRLSQAQLRSRRARLAALGVAVDAPVTAVEVDEFVAGLNQVAVRLVGVRAYMNELQARGRQPPKQLVDAWVATKQGFGSTISLACGTAADSGLRVTLPEAVWSRHSRGACVTVLSDTEFLQRARSAGGSPFAGLGDVDWTLVGAGAATVLGAGLALFLAPGVVAVSVVVLAGAAVMLAHVLTRDDLERQRANVRDGETLAALTNACIAGKCPENVKEILATLKQRSQERQEEAGAGSGFGLGLGLSFIPVVIAGAVALYFFGPSIVAALKSRRLSAGSPAGEAQHAG